MTLLETIAVLVILSGVVTASLGMIGPMSVAASRQQAVAVVESFFERARLLAVQSGGAMVTSEDSLNAVADDQKVDGSDLEYLVIKRALPNGWSCELRGNIDSISIDSLRILGSGVSVDCSVLLSNNRGDLIAIKRLGASGQTRIVDQQTVTAP